MRSVDLHNAAPVAPRPQAAPQLMWVDISVIRFDDAFQRPLGRSNRLAIQKIADQFQWSRFTPVLLAPIPDGLYSCLDGQHRTHAAAICGFKTVPSMVVLVPPSEMASAFVHINTSRIAVSGHNIYRAALMGGEGWALECQGAVEAAGCKLAAGKGSTADKKPGTIYAIHLIKKLASANNGLSVTAGLIALRNFDTAGRVALWSDYVLAPWLGAVAASGVTDVAQLEQVLHRRDPFLVIETANREAKATGKPTPPLRRRMFELMIGACV